LFGDFEIGRAQYPGMQYVEGYIDEFRFMFIEDEPRPAGAAWHENFTPDTSPYDTDSMTAILLHFDGEDTATETISYASTTIELIGSPSITNEFSAFEDGDGSLDTLSSGVDKLTLHIDSHYRIHELEFTVDCWLYFTTIPADSSQNYIMDMDDYCRFYHIRNAGLEDRIYFGYGSSYLNLLMGTVFTVETWHHIAITRHGPDNQRIFNFYVDGVWQGGLNDAQDLGTLWWEVVIGTNADQFYPFPGYIDEFRMVLGTCMWTNDFTPEIAPYSYAGGQVFGFGSVMGVPPDTIATICGVPIANVGKIITVA
jgi:hypothetical protein